MKKSTNLFIYLFILSSMTILLSSCGSKLEGNVVDIFGTPVSDAEIQIENTDYKAKTDKNGHFEMKFKPGEFSIKYSKKEYTSHIIKLNRPDDKSFKTDTVMIYPNPKEKGIYFINNDEKKIDKIDAYPVESMIHEEMTRYGFKEKSTIIALLSPGKSIITSKSEISFLDNEPNEIHLAKTNNNNQVQYRIKSAIDLSDRIIFSDFQRDVSYSVGEEKIMIRTISSIDKNQQYVWTPSYRNNSGWGDTRIFASTSGMCYPFIITESK